MMSLLFFFIFFYFFLVGSFHSLLILMIVELLVLLCILLLPMHSLTFVFSITFLLFSVCLSSYGVSLIIKTYREVGSFYMMSVNLF